MKYYELTYLISPELNEEEIKNFSQKIQSFIQTESGILDETKTPTKIKLGYPINKSNSAYLVSVEFHLSPEKLATLEKKLKNENQVLRFMILTKKSSTTLKSLKTSKGLSQTAKKSESAPIKKEKKVELKEIEKKLDEILEE